MHNFINKIVKEEEVRNNGILHMTANENILSNTARMAMSTSLSNRYQLGTANDENNSIVQRSDFILRGLSNLFTLESMASDYLNSRLGGVATDFRSLSGVHSMICSIASLTNPGDIVVSLSPRGGGHHATASLINLIGRKSILVDFDENELTVSLVHLIKIKKENNIKVIFLDDGAPLYPIRIDKIREIVGDEVLIIYDASHTLGLIYGHKFIDPIAQSCDIIQGNTHKTFPGPHKALLHYRDKDIASRSMQTMGEALVSSQHTNHSLALYVTILEMDQFADSYAETTVLNAQILSEKLFNLGLNVLTNGKSFTQSNQLFIHIPKSMSPHQAYKKMLDCNISINVKQIYNQDFIRIGVQELTRLGMKTDEMFQIAEIIKRILLDNAETESLISKVEELRNSFTTVQYSFDQVESWI